MATRAATHFLVHSSHPKVVLGSRSRTEGPRRAGVGACMHAQDDAWQQHDMALEGLTVAALARVFRCRTQVCAPVVTGITTDWQQGHCYAAPTERYLTIAHWFQFY